MHRHDRDQSDSCIPGLTHGGIKEDSRSSRDGDLLEFCGMTDMSKTFQEALQKIPGGRVYWPEGSFLRREESFTDPPQ